MIQRLALRNWLTRLRTGVAVDDCAEPYGRGGDLSESQFEPRVSFAEISLLG